MQDSAANDLNVLVDVARRLAESFELDSLLQSIEQAGRTALACDRATVFLYDAARDELYSKVATGTEEIRFPARLGIAGEAVKTGRIILVPDAYADCRFNREIDRQTGYRTRNLLTIPLIAPGGQVMGALQVLNKLDGDFGPHDETLATALGALTAVAIRRQVLLDEAAEKQRLERELNIARSIQQNLLPKEMPQIEGFDVAGWNLPADQTGGDCFDFFSLDGSRLAVMIADATGHGIGPALIISQCRSVLRALADTQKNPSQLISRLNDLLCEDLPSDRFVTMCLGVLDAAANRLDFVSAGHGPQIHLRAATGEVREFRATGLPMGIIAGTGFELAEPIVFEPGDVFLMMTDGFVEWSRPDGKLYGDARLTDLIRAHHQEPCEQLIQTIHKDVLRFSEGTAQLDDLTAIAIKRMP